MISLLISFALAQDPPDLREAIGGGAAVNWTTLTLEVTNVGQGRGVAATRKAVEAGARSGLREQVRSAVEGVRVGPHLYVNDLFHDEVIGETVTARAERWAVGETRYYASGRIEVVAEMSLLDLLKPYSLGVAKVKTEELRQPAVTGILIDARGTGATPAWAPRVLADSDRVLWDGCLWSDLAVTTSPVLWVPDPAHAAVARVGEDPLVVHAARANGADLILDYDDGVRFRTALEGSEVLRSGAIVVIVDP